MRRMLAILIVAAVALIAACKKSDAPAPAAGPAPPTGPGAPGAPGAPGMTPGAPGAPTYSGPGMPPGGPGATAKTETPKKDAKPEPKKPVDLTDDPFASESGAASGKTTPSRALGKAILRSLPLPTRPAAPPAKMKPAP